MTINIIEPKSIRQLPQPNVINITVVKVTRIINVKKQSNGVLVTK